jgi:tetratricopeptide (TPR) repeat protein
MTPDAAARGRALYESRRFPEALAFFEGQADDSSAPGEALYWAGLSARALARHDDAIDHLYLAAHYLPGKAAVWLALADTLQLAARPDDAMQAYREAARLEPADASAEAGMARSLKSLDRLSEALPHFQRSVELAPSSAANRALWALALLRDGQIERAAEVCAAACQLDPACVEAWHHGALIQRELGAIERARQMFERALALRPEAIEIRSALANTLRDLGRFNEALAQYDAVLARDPRLNEAQLNRAYAKLMTGRLADGWDEYEQRLEFRGVPPPPVPLPRWRGEAGARVLVYGEQGLGDEIMFASCLPDLAARAEHVSLACHTRLAALFRRSFPAFEVRPSAEIAPAARRASCVAAIGSLPAVFRRSAEAFPSRAGYLRADPRAVSRWQERLRGAGGRLRVGISWRGGSLRTRGHLRSIAPDEVARLGAVPRVRWLSLQYGNAETECQELAARGMPIERAVEIEADLDACAAAIEALDLVISIDNTVAHLAGAIGKPLWIALPAGPEWRYGLVGDAMPWYPRARLIRQREGEGWRPVLETIHAALENEANERE